jgi:putative transposase
VSVWQAVKHFQRASDPQTLPPKLVAICLGVRCHGDEIGPTKKRFTRERFIVLVRDAEGGLSANDLCGRQSFSEASYYLLLPKFGGMSVSDANRLEELETANPRLKHLLSETLL